MPDPKAKPATKKPAATKPKAKPTRELMIEAALEVGAIRKEGKNTHQKYSFRGIEQVLGAVHTAILGRGVIITQRIVNSEMRIDPNQKGQHPMTVALVVEYTFRGPVDELVTESYGLSTDYQDKAGNQALSQALKMCLLQLFLSPTDEPDADSFSPHAEADDGTPAPRPAVRKPAKPAPRVEQEVTVTKGVPLPPLQMTEAARQGDGSFPQVCPYDWGSLNLVHRGQKNTAFIECTENGCQGGNVMSGKNADRRFAWSMAVFGEVDDLFAAGGAIDELVNA